MSKIISSIEETILNILISAMTLLVFLEVIARFFFNTGFMWIQELTLTLCGWFVLFGMSYGVKVGAHIGVDAFVSKLSGTPRKVVAIIACSCCLVYCAMFLQGSWQYLQQMYQIGLGMEDIHLPMAFVQQFDPDALWDTFKIDVEDPAIPIWISQSIIFIGFLMLTFRFLELLYQIITNQSVGFKLADEAKESMHLIDDSATQPTNNNNGADQ